MRSPVKRFPSTPPELNSLPPGRHCVGECLYLEVDQPRSGRSARRWLLRTRIRGRRRDIGLGSYPTVSLKDAKEKAKAKLILARQGGDPLLERQARRACPTFEAAANEVHAHRSARWKNAKHREQWLTSLQTYAFPILGQMRVHEIQSQDVLEVLKPIWLTKQETAGRVLQRISLVLKWSKVSGNCKEDVSQGVQLVLPYQDERQKHHRALPYTELNGFIRDLRDASCSRVTRLAFEFLILTVARTNEVLGLRWREINGDVWTLPEDRSKTGRSIQIPLVPRALEILEKAGQWSRGDGYVFPGRTVGQPLSNMTLLMALERMGKRDVCVPHGFRSTFYDWASDETDADKIAIKKSLNHAIPDKVEAAYRRGELWRKRLALMSEWERFATA